MEISLDHKIQKAAEEFVEKIDVLSSDPNIRTAIVKCAIRDITWELFESFDDRIALSEQLTVLAGLVEEKDLNRDEEEE